MEAAAAVENRNGRFPTAAWKTLRVSHSSHSPRHLGLSTAHGNQRLYSQHVTRAGPRGGMLLNSGGPMVLKTDKQERMSPLRRRTLAGEALLLGSKQEQQLASVSLRSGIPPLLGPSNTWISCKARVHT